MSDEPKTEKPAATPEAIDPKEVRAQLGLPENAPDADVIAGLLAVIAALSQKYETLLADSAGQEAEIANRALEQYADRIPAGTEDFWRDQLLANRAATLAVLDKLPKPAAEAAPAPAPAPAAEPAPTPLRNRLPSAPPTRPPNCRRSPRATRTRPSSSSPTRPASSGRRSRRRNYRPSPAGTPRRS